MRTMMGAIAAMVFIGGVAFAAPPVPDDTPVQPDTRNAPVGGGWTRDGWSDAISTPALARPGGAPSSQSRRAASGGAVPRAVVSPPALPYDATIDDAPSRPAGPPPRLRHASDGAAYGDVEAGAPRSPEPSRRWGHDGTRGDRAWRPVRRDDWRHETWDGGRGRDFRYRRGDPLPGIFGQPAYLVSDWAGYDLAPPPAGARWIRYFDDAVLVDSGGVVIDAVPAIGWAQPARPYDAPPPAVRYGEPYRPYPAGPGTTVTQLPGGGTIVVTTTTTPAVATTTTTVEERAVSTSRAAPRRPYRRAAR